MSYQREHRVGEWQCACHGSNLHAASCLTCLRCGVSKPDPVTLGRACFALGAFMRAVNEGKTQEQAMQAALEADMSTRGKR